ncbi:MAG: MBL fold metallo-hydrolase [Gammaproteobacteria bacterium]|jgi:L-ascorbate metabolism protein UlaG (beta-lactamase superfamily)
MKFHLILISMLTLVPLHTSHAQLNNDRDRIQTNNGELSVYPILHGSIVFEWNGVDIYIDPYGGAERFNNQAIPDLILISHPHDDHFHLDTLKGLNTSQATFIVPEAVAEMMPAEYSNQIVILKNGESTELNGVSILAVPMYNLPEEGARHAKGWGNGYILTLGGKSVYVSGDTEDIPEMRELDNIDVAFVCMNLPYTMDINQAASAVLEFEPDVMYPYHHRGQDIEQFKALVNAKNNNIDVRLKDWYSE